MVWVSSDPVALSTPTPCSSSTDHYVITLADPQQQQQAVGLFIKHEKVTGLSKRNVTKYESLSSSSSPYFILFHPHIDADNQCQSPLRLVAIRILRMYSVQGLSGSMIIIRSKIFVSYYEIGVLIRMCLSLIAQWL